MVVKQFEQDAKDSANRSDSKDVEEDFEGNDTSRPNTADSNYPFESRPDTASSKVDANSRPNTAGEVAKADSTPGLHL